MYMLLLCMHGDGNCYSCVVLYRLMMWMLRCVCHEWMSVVYEFVMHVISWSWLCMYNR